MQIDVKNTIEGGQFRAFFEWKATKAYRAAHLAIGLNATEAEAEDYAVDLMDCSISNLDEMKLPPVGVRAENRTTLIIPDPPITGQPYCQWGFDSKPIGFPFILDTVKGNDLAILGNGTIPNCLFVFSPDEGLPLRLTFSDVIHSGTSNEYIAILHGLEPNVR